MINDLNYTIVPLKNLLAACEGSEERVQTELDKFSCVNNRDVERFLKEKAVVFDKQGWAKTHLLYTSYKGQMVLVGYFALANKNFIIKNNSKVSKTTKKRIKNFGQYNDDLKQYVVVASLIGQLGKNDTHKDLIDGATLLKYACDEVRKVQGIVGGRFVYLECEDKAFLKEFYLNNGFVEFGKRELDLDEKDDITGVHLIQMLRYL